MADGSPDGGKNEIWPPQDLASLEPAENINLRLILVSGKTKEFVFNPVDSAGDIAIHVYDNWPEADWATECVSRAEILRLIYQGRFLHSSVTLGALGLPLGRTTVMHLVPREHLPEPNSHVENETNEDLLYRSSVDLTISYPPPLSFYLINGKKVKAVQAVVVQRLAAYCNGFLCERDAVTRAAARASETADNAGIRTPMCSV
ncbi:unnamed protein product [Chrysodeixis includens]|uniref:UBL3-like ubiquitin domain-containing protein n=1 Tax=Chrysodeixis includens TaxID=689277 RepID=A0A9N8KYU1_CHRIL|nr:unnamed protein product [Chrysodeixis includens]